ncbi:LysM domain-containing protein [Amycolatopsis sp. cg5]|uniref:LysM domain-containing protein n=1 Tax=Amycolatopsis sp. cg5 TaxID=3238802 RepID=UPI00352311FA
MTSPMDAMAAAMPTTTPYPRSSRHYGIPMSTHVTPDGRTVPYLKRRLLPSPKALVTMAEHTVNEGDRADLLAERYLGDAEAWWRIADANPVLDPRELTDEPGTRLRITLPQGVPGNG